MRRDSRHLTTSPASVERLEDRTLLTTYTVDTLSDAVADDGLLSLREAILAADTNTAVNEAAAGEAAGDVIQFAASLTGGTIVMTSGQYFIREDLRIDGADRDITINADNQSRIFIIDGTDKAEIVDLTLENGKFTSGSGGAVFIRNSERVSFLRVTIRDSRAFQGGAIASFNSQLEFTEGQLDGNDARLGGGFHIHRGRAVFLDSQVTTNSARFGGGIFNAGELELISSSVSENSATLSTTGSGGGIFNVHVLTVTDSRIEDNTASGEQGKGGGIDSQRGTVVVSRSHISRNTAGRSGGGVELRNTDATFTDTLFDSNEAGIAGMPTLGDGGGLHVTGFEGFASQVTLHSTIVTLNQATGSGGGLWMENATIVTLDRNSVVANNTALGDGPDEGGGGIYNDGGRLNINASSVTSNRADGAFGKGGGIFSNRGIVNIDGGSTVDGNRARQAGGGIELQMATLNMSDSFLRFNTTGIFPEVATEGYGGGLHVTGAGSRANLHHVDVSQNQAARQGGGLWNDAHSVIVLTGGTTVTDNLVSDAQNADDGGGGIYSKGRLAVFDSMIDDNRAEGTDARGGGVFAVNEAFTAENSTINGNSASGHGGGVETQAGIVTLTNTDISSNRAGISRLRRFGDRDGGGLHNAGRAGQVSRVTIVGGSISDNLATGGGGGLWNAGPGNFMVVNGSVVSSNSAVRDGGGGIHNHGGSLVIKGMALLKGNYAAGNSEAGDSASGGGVYTLGGVVTIQGGTQITNNRAKEDGGGIEIVNGRLNVIDSHISQNTAGYLFRPKPGGFYSPGVAIYDGSGNGGGIHVSGNLTTRVTIRGGSITGNTANGFVGIGPIEGEGGGLWNSSTGIMIIGEGVTIDGNTTDGDGAKSGGGGIYNDGGRLAITSSTISNNRATGSRGATGSGAAGGGVYSIGGGLTIDNSTISGNSADGKGGGIRSNGTLVMVNVTVANNRSNADGRDGGLGGGLFNGGQATLRNSLVAGNVMGVGTTLSDIAGNNVQPNSLHNLISDAATSGGLTHGTLGNIVGNEGVGSLLLSDIVDPLLDNGGTTQTQALAAESLAIDAGDSDFAKDIYGKPFARDQRGIGFPRIKSDAVDIGAFEV